MGRKAEQNRISSSQDGVMLEHRAVYDDSLLPSAEELAKLKDIDPEIIPWIKKRTETEQEAGVDRTIEIQSLHGAERRVETVRKWECVTSHTARRTFVCNSISLGIPPNVIMKWTGHTDYKSMKPYIDVMSHTKKENMNLYNDLPDLPNISSKK